MQRQVARPVRRGAVGKVPARATRWPPTLLDGVFFLDLPAPRERALIWRIYLEKFGLDPEQPRPGDAEWSGAEIRACCRLAALLDLPVIEAAGNIVPVAVTAGESVERLRSWAGGRCLSAGRPGIYTRGCDAIAPAGRNVRRGPSNN